MRWLSRVPGQVWAVMLVGLLGLGGGVYTGEVFRTPIRHFLFNVFGVGKQAEIPPKLGAASAEGDADASASAKSAPGRGASASGKPADPSASAAEAGGKTASVQKPASESASGDAAAPADGQPSAYVNPGMAASAEAPSVPFAPAWSAVPTQSPPAAKTAPASALPPSQAAATPGYDRAVSGDAAGNEAVADWMAMPVTVRIKVFVDELYARAHPDWLSQVQRTVALTSAALRLAVRVDLELIGVVRFAEPLDGLALPALLSTIKHRALDGADVAVAFVDHELPPEACEGGDVGSMHNGSYGAVGPDLTAGYFSGLLRCLGQMLGAELVTDQESQAYRLGSFMRPDLNLSGQQAPWLDPENRARMMQRKGLPFGQPGGGRNGRSGQEAKP